MGRGSGGDKKGGRQVYQNKVKFDPNRYKNEKDRLPSEILVPMTSLCCRRCCDIIRWKADYGKYIPSERPRKCNRCEEKTIGLAYHHICQPCAERHRICAKCQKSPFDAVADLNTEDSNSDDDSCPNEEGVAKAATYAFVDEEPNEEQLKPLQGLDVRMVRKKLLSQLAAEERDRLKFLRERERRSVMRKAKVNAAGNEDDSATFDSDEELL